MTEATDVVAPQDSSTALELPKFVSFVLLMVWVVLTGAAYHLRQFVEFFHTSPADTQHAHTQHNITESYAR